MQGQLAHYEIEQEIGHGGMGVVYRARDLELQRRVAIKVLPSELASDPERRSRLKREARAAAQLNHPNIATIYEVGEAEVRDEDGSTSSCLYISMEYVEGEDLDQRLGSGELPISESLELGLQISSGLEAAHKAGVVHRDLKPHNIRITPEGTAKILDFGLAKLVPEESVIEEVPAAGETLLTSEGMIVGTVPYMAPEQLEGKGDSRCDLFSFGVVLYQMITGRLPFAGGNLVQFLKNLANTDPEPMSSSNPAVSRELEGIVGRLLAKNPEERYQSATEVRSDLKLLSGGSLPTLPHPRTRLLQQRKTLTFPAWLPWAAALSLIAVGTLFWIRWTEKARAPRTLTVLPISGSAAAGEESPLCREIDRLLLQRLRDPKFLLLDFAKLSAGSTAGHDLFRLARDRQADIVLTTSCREEPGGLIVDIGLSDVGTSSSLLAKRFEIPHASGAEEDLKAEIVYQANRALQVVQTTDQALQADNRRLTATLLSAFYQSFYQLENFEDPSDLEPTIRTLEEIADATRDFALAHTLLSEAIIRRYGPSIDPDNLQTALAAATQAQAIAPALPAANIARARAVRRTAGGLAESQSILEQNARINPLDAQSHYELGHTLRMRGDLEAAITSYTRAIKNRPGYWRYFYQRALALEKDGQLEAAKEDLLQAIERAEPSNPAPWTGLAMLELRGGNYRKAAEVLDRVPGRGGSAALSAMKGASYYFARDWDSAARAYREAISFDDENPSTWATLGDCQIQLEQPAAAETSYKKALGLSLKRIAREPDNIRFRTWHPTYQAKSGDCGSALQYADSLTDELPTDSELAVARARPYALCGKHERARAILREAVRQGTPTERLMLETDFEEVLEPGFRAELLAIHSDRDSAGAA